MVRALVKLYTVGFIVGKAGAAVRFGLATHWTRERRKFEASGVEKPNTRLTV